MLVPTLMAGLRPSWLVNSRKIHLDIRIYVADIYVILYYITPFPPSWFSYTKIMSYVYALQHVLDNLQCNVYLISLEYRYTFGSWYGVNLPGLLDGDSQNHMSLEIFTTVFTQVVNNITIYTFVRCTLIKKLSLSSKVGSAP